MKLLLPVCLGLAAVASAQTKLTLPSEFDRHFGTSSTSLLGSAASRTQLVFASPFAVGTPVLGFGLRCTGSTVDRAAFTATIAVDASSTVNAPGALSGTFASNVGSDVVSVIPQGLVNIAAMPANRSTGTFAEFPFNTPFVFGTNGNTNINVEVRVYSRSTGASWSTDRAFAATAGRASNHGIGCGSGTVSSTTAGGTYVAGSTMTITLANATPLQGAWLLPSFNLKDLGGVVPLPFSLALIGAGVGCDLLVDPAVGSIPLVADGAGGASVAIPISAGTPNIRTGWQWIYQVPPSGSNPLGLATTAVRAIRIGGETVVPNAQYVWDLTSATIATGLSTTDSVPVVEFILP